MPGRATNVGAAEGGTRMASEIELKLEVPSASLGKTAELPWLRALSCGPTRREKLVSVYFDTPKLRLRDSGVAVRVRHIGKTRLQTIKALRKGGRGGALGRGEWEREIDGEMPDLSRSEDGEDTALRPIATKKLRRKLRPVFETVVERLTLPVHSNGTEIEVAVDRGYIKSGQRRKPISEVELELKQGEAAELAELARRLAASVPAAYGPRPKQDRGYALLADEAGDAVRAAPIGQDPTASTAEAFRVIAFAALDHALSNERAVRDGDAEGIHQMRVGLRRLRAALSLFKPVVEGPQTDALKTELKWLTDELGPARELDVLIARRVEPARETAPAEATGELAEELGAERDTAFAKAARAVDSERYRALGLDTALWILDGAWSRSDDAMVAAQRERPAAAFAAEVLDARLAKILKRARKLAELSPRRRHKLRIAVKKLRYATEFFAALFPGGKSARRRQRVAGALKELQGALGTLNDIEAHLRIAGTIANRRKSARHQPQQALAIGFITGQEQPQRAACLNAALAAARHLGDVKRFWR